MHMKWWGWGDPDKQFSLDERPAAWPYLQRKVGLSETVQRAPMAIDEIQLPPSRLSNEAIEALEAALGAVNCSTAARDRLTHAFGKSYRDLVRARRGEVTNPPDAVVYPMQEAHVEAVLSLAGKHGFAVVPFGGGTSVVGGLEMPASQQSRPFVSLDLKRLAELVAVDKLSMTATAQSGMLGPRLEEALQAQGVTLGHYPQSFEFSTLGGWVATRSAGQQSTKYGKIEQMVLGLRLVTPRGVLVTPALPAHAQGPDLNHVAIGAEGRTGVISEVTLKVHPVPERRDYRAMIFANWAQGQAAVRELLQSDRHPATLRLSDAAETEALFKLRESGEPSRLAEVTKRVFQWYLKRMREVDLSKACMLIMGFEGPADQVDQARDACQATCERHRGVSLGASAGESWYRSRFELPYMRDTLLDRGVLVDTLETCTTWSRLDAVYQAVGDALRGAIAADGLEPFVLCHISHPYHAGASLYFTFMARQLEGQELEQWARYKRAATDAIVAAGGALSHHHGVGLDHAPWYPAVAGERGVACLEAVKLACDPDDMMNPGKIVPHGA